jgi:hypothetical protein
MMVSKQSAYARAQYACVLNGFHRGIHFSGSCSWILTDQGCLHHSLRLAAERLLLLTWLLSLWTLCCSALASSKSAIRSCFV